MSSPHADDAELVAAVLRGDRDAREQLARRWSGRIVAVCRARIGREDIAEDLAQETLIRGLTQLAQLKNPDGFGSWLRGIAINVCLDWIRTRKQPTATVNSLQYCLDNQTSSATQQLVMNEERAQLDQAIAQLPEAQRECLMLFYFDEMTYEQIASMLDVSRTTVNQRLAKARETLNRLLSFTER